MVSCRLMWNRPTATKALARKQAAVISDYKQKVPMIYTRPATLFWQYILKDITLFKARFRDSLHLAMRIRLKLVKKSFMLKKRCALRLYVARHNPTSTTFSLLLHGFKVFLTGSSRFGVYMWWFPYWKVFVYHLWYRINTVKKLAYYRYYTELLMYVLVVNTKQNIVM